MTLVNNREMAFSTAAAHHRHENGAKSRHSPYGSGRRHHECGLRIQQFDDPPTKSSGVEQSFVRGT